MPFVVDSAVLPSPPSLVSVVQTVEVPGRSVVLIRGGISNNTTGLTEGLVEGVDPKEKPNALLVARSLVSVSPLNEVMIQVVNLRPVPVKLFKGTKVVLLPLDTIKIT